jgi:amino acid permease
MKQDADGKVRGMSVLESTLSIISCIIGAGIVSIPYALTATGLYNGILINIGIIICLMFATHLYIKSMEYLKLSSISELCFMSMGRSSIFIVNAFFAFIFVGVLTLFNVLFSNLAV